MAGTYVYPDGQYFARHDNCDCLFVVSGYNSRNGILKNYTKTTRKQTTKTETTANSPTSTNSAQIRDVTQETLKRATPRVGNIKYADNWPAEEKVGQEEQLFANWLLNTLGGDIVHIPRSEVAYQKTPDYEWNGVPTELKTLTTQSLNGVSRKTREASKQAGESGIVWLDLTGATELWQDTDALYGQIKRDLKRFGINDIFVKRNNELIKHYTKGSP